MYRRQAITRFFASFQDVLARDRARAIRLFFVGIIAYGLVALGMLAYFTAPITARQWPDLFTGQYSHITSIVSAWSLTLEPAVIVAALFALGMWPYVTQRSPQAFTRALFNAVAARDSRVTRTVTPTASDEAATSETLTLEGLAHPVGVSATNIGAIYVFAGCLIFVMSVILLVLSIADAHSLLSDPSLGPIVVLSSMILPILIMSLGLIYTVFGVVTWRFYSIARAGFTATVDSAGIAMRRARGRPHERRIAWRDVRGFAQVIYYLYSAMPLYAYILDAENERFIWVAPPVAEGVGASHGALAWAQRDSAQRLAALVERHTRLPLLDISVAIHAATGGLMGQMYEMSLAERGLAVALASGDGTLAPTLLERLRPAGPFSRVPRGLARVMVWWSVRWLDPDARTRLLATARALLPYYPYPNRPNAPVPRPLSLEARFLRAYWLTLRQAVVVALIIAWLLSLTTLWTPSIISRLYQQPLEALTATRVASQRPLYFAALTAPTIGWPTHAATTDDPRAARFTAQGYALSTGESPTFVQDTFAWNPTIQAPANSALMVTVTVSPAVGGGNGSPADVTIAGILFNGDASGTRGMLFTVDSFGDWTLERCDSLNNDAFPCPDILAQGDGSDYGNGPLAPRPGGTTTFHLLVIHQGRTYLLYANGAFLAAYHDDTGPATSGGGVGLYLDSLGHDARFTNFALYPAPTGLPFWAQ